MTMDDQPSGRVVYVVRRILAVLVILLLLALLVPQACQALLGSRDGTGSGAQDTADVDNSGDGGSEEENATNEETFGGADEVAGQEDATDNQSDSGETAASDGALRTSDDAETSEDEYAGVETLELDAGLAGAGELLEDVAIGEVDQIGPIPVFYAGSQQTIQPPAPVEPVVLGEPIAPVEPIIPVEPIAPVDPSVYAEPIPFEYLAYYEDPAYYEYPAFYEDLAYYEYLAYYEDPAYYEEQIFEEPYTLGASYDAAAFETVSEEEGGGFGAYAAISAD